MAKLKPSPLKTPYWKTYYDTVKKHRNKIGRPVKDCVACGLPIINPKKYKANVHVSNIPGIRSECAKKRDSDYKKSKNIPGMKMPDGLLEDLNDKSTRVCLKCSEDFPSESAYNRVCIRCTNLQPDLLRISPHATVLETGNIQEMIDYGY